MVYLNDLFSFDALREEMDAGYVKERRHPSAPLAILNYTAQAQYAHRWTEVTRQTRGLVYNTKTFEVVARPWEKFFNIDQVETPTPPQGAAMIRSEKMDGSLGVVFVNPDTGGLEVATRGSFTSDQAVHATRRLQETLDGMDEDTHAYASISMKDSRYTYLFEIVFPENRIVVDYGDMDELVLLDVLNNETGKSQLELFDQLPWPVKTDKTLVPGGFYDTIFSDIPEGNEGFVLYWPHSGVRAKVKAARYLELHRIVFGLSKKSIWQDIDNGKTIDELKEDIPDEFYDFVDETYRELKTQQLRIFNEVLDAWNEIAYKSDIPVILKRKDFALKAVKYKDVSKFLFKILDGADEVEINKKIWKDLKPVGDTRMTEQSEDVA